MSVYPCETCGVEDCDGVCPHTPFPKEGTLAYDLNKVAYQMSITPLLKEEKHAKN